MRRPALSPTPPASLLPVFLVLCALAVGVAVLGVPSSALADVPSAPADAAQDATDGGKTALPENTRKAGEESNPPAGDEDGSNAPESESGEKAAAESGEATISVELLDAGVGEKSKLRFRPDPGNEQTVVIELSSRTSVKVGSLNPPEQRMPTQRLEMDFRVTRVDPDTGNFTYKFRLSKAEVDDAEGVPPFVTAAIRDALSSTVGLEGTITATPTGRTEKLEFDIPDTASPIVKQSLGSIRQSISQLSQPLPEEAVGKGARWRTRGELDANGIKFTQAATFKLVAIDGERHVLEVELEQSAEPQEVDMPIPGGGKVRLQSLKGMGKGKTEFRLGSITPHSEIEVKVASTLTMDVGGQPQTMDMNVTSSTAVRPRSEPSRSK